MSKTGSRTAGRRARRQFSDEFRAGAVRLVLDEGKTVGAVARDLDLTASALAHWVKRGRADRTKDKTGLTTVEREELARLRKENNEPVWSRNSCGGPVVELQVWVSKSQFSRRIQD